MIFHKQQKKQSCFLKNSFAQTVGFIRTRIEVLKICSPPRCSAYSVSPANIIFSSFILSHKTTRLSRVNL